MFQKIKRKVGNLFSQIFDLQFKEKGGILVPIIFFVAVLATGVGAGIYIYENIGDIGRNILWLLYYLTREAARLGSLILQYVTSPDFFNFSITKNDAVLHGWGIVRDFSNMFIVLGFVIVGIATALKFREYEAQKALLPLILVALLINFTPVICGVMIDASNIIMSYFIESQASPAGVAGPITAMLTEDFENKIENYGKNEQMIALVSGSFFNVIAAIVFFIFSVLFLFRYVALMCLVILSPLAFVCYVFERTRSIWKMWWNQFFQWCIVGIPAAFFLYLASLMIVHYNIDPKFPSMTQEQQSLFGLIIPCGFLLVGYFFTLQTGAMGGKAAIGLLGTAAGMAWGATKGVTKWAGKKGWGGAKAAGKWGAKKGVSAAKTWMPETVRRWGEQAATAPGARGVFGRLIGGRIAAVTESERKEVDAVEKSVTGQSATSQLRAFRRLTISDKERVGILNAMTKDGNLGDAMDGARFGRGAITRTDIERLYPTAQRYDKHSALRDAFPAIAVNNLPANAVPRPIGMTDAQYRGLQWEHVFRQIKPANYKQLSRDAIAAGPDGDQFVDTLLHFGRGEHARGILDNLGQEGANRMRDRLNQLAISRGALTPAGTPDREAFLKAVNPALQKYLKKSVHIAGIL